MGQQMFKPLFKLKNKDSRATYLDFFLLSQFLTLSRYLCAGLNVAVFLTQCSIPIPPRNVRKPLVF